MSETRASRKPPLIGGVIPAKRADVVERPRFATHDPLAGDEIGARGVLGLAFQHGLIKARGEDIDQVDVARELPLLLSRDVGGDEDPEVTARLVDRVHYRLAIRPDLLGVFVKVQNPAERLLWR